MRPDAQLGLLLVLGAAGCSGADVASDAGLAADAQPTVDAGLDAGPDDASFADAAAPDAGPAPTLRIERVGAIPAGVHGLAIALNGAVYLSDSYGSREVLRWAPPYDEAPAPTGISGTIPSGLFVDGPDLIVADVGAETLTRYRAADALQLERLQVGAVWNFVRDADAWLAVTFGGDLVRIAQGQATTLQTGLRAPFDLALAPDGTRWVTEQERGVYRWDASGAELEALQGPWDNPEGLLVDLDGRVWVADTGAGMVRVRQVDGTWLEADVGGLPVCLAADAEGVVHATITGSQPALIRLIVES